VLIAKEAYHAGLNEINRLFINVLNGFMTAKSSFSVLLQCFTAVFFTQLSATVSGTAKEPRYTIRQQGG
jgi:hypothetical protein